MDPCIFYRDGIILISWVDDCLIFTKSEKVAKEYIESMHQQFTLTKEGDISAYLGVKLQIDDVTDTVTMSQPFLIERIIESLGNTISDANVKDTPAVYKEILHKDADGPEHKKT